MTHDREDASILELVRELVADVRTLIRQEIALARAEFHEELAQLAGIAALAGVTLALLAVSGLWTLIAVTRGLAAVFNWPLGAVYGGIGLVLGAAAVILSAVVWHQVRTLRVLPKTRESIRAHVHKPLESSS